VMANDQRKKESKKKGVKVFFENSSVFKCNLLSRIKLQTPV